MADIKWIKIKTDMFEDEKIKLIDALPERDTIHYIWLRLLVQAGKTNASGYIFLNENVPYTEEMLSTIFCRPLNSIRLALSTLSNFGMIEIKEDKIIKITNWEKHQNVEGMERVREQGRIRAQRKREKDKLLKEKSEKLVPTNDENNVTEIESNVTVTEQNKNKNKELEEDIKNKKEEIDIKKRELEEEQVVVVATKIIKDYEELTGTVGIFNIGAIKLALKMHGEKYLRMAIDKGMQANRMNMTYINGILRNWAYGGYPKEDVNEQCMLSNGNEFKGFKPKKWNRKSTSDESDII